VIILNKFFVLLLNIFLELDFFNQFLETIIAQEAKEKEIKSPNKYAKHTKLSPSAS
jgi:hypothetical protein